MRGSLIAFSGLDGAGKSTQIGLLRSHLMAQGRRTVQFWARGGYTPLFSAAKAILRRIRPGALPAPGQSAQRSERFASKRVRRLWLTLAVLDLLLWYGGWLRWQRWRGLTVLCDRYLDDTLLDFRRNFPRERVEAWTLWRLLQRMTPKPDAAFLLLLPVEESQRRCRQKNEPFPDSAETLAWRLEQYEALARQGHWQRIDARRAVGEIRDEVRRRIDA